MSFRAEWMVPHLISIVVGLLMALAAWKRPNLGRALYALLFAWAAPTNLYTALFRARDYLGYADLTDSAVYRSIILGPFARHIVLYVSLIALAQLLIGLAMLGRGWLPRAACAAAILFFVAIAPLGVGSAFPATLLMAGGAAALLTRALPALPVRGRARHVHARTADSLNTRRGKDGQTLTRFDPGEYGVFPA